jgi:divinyl protochlorophyllide a 8-vinyl-reductase
MPDGTFGPARTATGLIGPNAILQLIEPVNAALGPTAMNTLLARCNVALPSGHQMIDEDDVVRVHRTLAQTCPDQAQHIAIAAGIGTARYICANRIPKPARIAFHALPHRIGEILLTRAIAAHAWTFCGSGTLQVQAGRPIRFDLQNNPMAKGYSTRTPNCHWHRAVFAELFSVLLGRPYTATEVECCCVSNVPACRFEVAPQQGARAGVPHH